MHTRNTIDDTQMLQHETNTTQHTNIIEPISYIPTHTNAHTHSHTTRTRNTYQIYNCPGALKIAVLFIDHLNGYKEQRLYHK